MNQEYLKSVLCYNKETGVFIWEKTKSNRSVSGTIAGSVKNGYRTIRINKKDYYAHRLAWLYVKGKMPMFEIDHINHRKDDNRFINLREVTHSENRKNSKILINNSSGATGVSKRKNGNTWRARIYTNGREIYLGDFKNKEDAIISRKEANNKYGFHSNNGNN